jgi:hypothetical protein
MYTWRGFFYPPPSFPLLPLPFPFCSPLYPFPLTWHPPAVTGIVLLSLRLLVNWPYLPHPSPNCPTLSKFPEPHATTQRLTTTTLGLLRSCYAEHLPLLIYPSFQVNRYSLWAPQVKGPNPCSSGYISTTHQSFLCCTLSPAIHFNGSNGTDYTRPSKVQHKNFGQGKRYSCRRFSTFVF